MIKTTWVEEGIIDVLGERIKKLKFADRVHLIKKLVVLIRETLDGIEVEAARKCP